MLLIIASLITLSSCSTLSSESTVFDYSKAMESVRGSIRKEGIPREKIFYHFQLMHAKSTRMQGGVRGGHMSVSETWELQGGYRLTAIEHTYVGRDLKITPLKDGESFFSDSQPLMMKEEYYHEPPLEPYFDTLYLFDSQDRRVEAIDLHYKNG